MASTGILWNRVGVTATGRGTGSRQGSGPGATGWRALWWRVRWESDLGCGVPTLDGLGAVVGHLHSRSEWVDVTLIPRQAFNGHLKVLKVAPGGQ